MPILADYSLCKPVAPCSLRVITDDGHGYTAQASYRLDRMQVSLAAFRNVCSIGLSVSLLLSIASDGVLFRRRPARSCLTICESRAVDSGTWNRARRSAVPATTSWSCSDPGARRPSSISSVPPAPCV